MFWGMVEVVWCGKALSICHSFVGIQVASGGAGGCCSGRSEHRRE